MSDLRKIWIAFIGANDLEIFIDFVNQRKIYSGLGMEGRTEEEFRKTVEFQGFLDGYERNPHKYSGSRGSPEQDAPGFIEEILSRIDNQFKGLVDPIVNENSGVQDNLRRIVVEIGKPSYRTRHGKQYSLGVASRGLVL
ncbi:hypothetical protein HY500_04395 [Candidatus Woesearchaeota archaeon]|nr:hypothetical protein [Candidatus Woesearchaeota archaeon]